MREKSVENDIKDYLFSKGIYFFKVHGSKFMPSGIPDIVCCFRGSFLGIEVKRPGAKNEQSEAQKVHERNIKKSGGTYLLVDSLREVVDYITTKEECSEQTTNIKTVESGNGDDINNVNQRCNIQHTSSE